jgi:hypothetical protein
MVTEAIAQFVIFVAVTVYLSWTAITRETIVPYFLAGFAWFITALVNFLLAPTALTGWTSLFFILLGMVFSYTGIQAMVDTQVAQKEAQRRPL